MAIGYETVRKTEESIQGFVKFIRYAGFTWVLPPANLPYAVFVPTFSALGGVHLLYSATYFTKDMADVVIVVYFSLLCFITVLMNLTVFLKRTTYYYVLTEACRSYDYGGETMRKKQNSLLSTKNSKLFKLRSHLLIMQACLMGNLIVTSVIERAFMGQRFLRIYPSWLPSGLRTDLVPVNLCTYAFESLEMALSGFAIFTAFGTAMFVYIHITSELLLFRVALGLLKERAQEMALEDGMDLAEAYRRAVRACSEHHRYIIEYFNVIQPVGKIVYTMIYSFGLMLLVFTGLVLKSNNSVALMKFVVITLIELSFLYASSWFSEEIAVSSGLANDAVYDVDWLAVPPDCRTTLRILLVGSQRPLNMKTHFGQIVNLDSYMGMLKAAYSYFNLVMLDTPS